MARKIKRRAKSKKRSVTKTITKKVYVKAKKAMKRARRAASQPVTKKDIVLAVAGAGVGGIGGAIVLSKIPESVPSIAANGGVAALGGVVTYVGLKKKNKVLMGAGLGMAAVGVRGVIANFVPTMAGYEAPIMYETPAQIAAPFAGYEPLSAPFDGEYEPLSAPFDGEETI